MVSFRAIDCYLASVSKTKEFGKDFYQIFRILYRKKVGEAHPIRQAFPTLANSPRKEMLAMQD